MAVMATRLTITIPGPVPRELSPNASWNVPKGMKNRLKDEMAKSWYFSALAAAWDGETYATTESPLMPDGPVRCQLTYYRPKRGKEWDGDNLLSTAKFGLDQLQQAGIVANDRQLKHQPVRFGKDPAGVGYLVVELEGETT
jgi:hypothetical protein